jgi:hypothetical protein
MRLSLVILVLAFIAGAAQAQIGAVVPNWAVPSSGFSSGSSSSSGSGLRTLADVTSPGTFVGVTPCRIVDTRGPAGPFGAPSLAQGSPRNFALRSGPCTGIAVGVASYSLNITVTNTLGPGFLLIFPQGGAQPLVSTLNYVAGQTVANAAIVPAGAFEGVTVIAGVSGTDLIIDINGYFEDSGTIINPGEVVGFRGSLPGEGLVFSENTNTSTFDSTSAFRGVMSGAGNGGSAIQGVQFTGSGVNYGVRGNNFGTTNGSAGVLGVSGTRTPSNTNFFPTGVRGESTGVRNGVLGTIQDFVGGGFAVGGFTFDATPAIVRAGRLGDSGSNLGVSYVGGLGGTGTKNFYEPHPTDPEKVIRYVALEGPEAGTYFRGRGVLEHGRAVIDVPESFRMVTDSDGLTAQVTVMGRPTAIGVSRLDLNQVVVEGNRDVEFSYLVQGVRRAYKDFQVVVDHPFFRPESPDDQVPASFSPDEKARLIANGTYNADGRVNMSTAERLGWAQQWRDRTRLEQERAAAEAANRTGRSGNRQ